MGEIAEQQALFTQQDVKYMVIFTSATLERNGKIQQKPIRSPDNIMEILYLPDKKQAR